jgi:hypothetical protein
MAIMMDEMERFYPQTSARVRLYRARAQLLCEEDPPEAARYLELAREWAPEVTLDAPCAHE